MRRIREILLTDYIGAIVIGMLISQALFGAISLLGQAIAWYQNSSSAFDRGSSAFPISSLLSPALTSVLYIVVSYLLFSWLYASSANPANNAQAQEPPATEN